MSWYPIPKCPACKSNLVHGYQQFWKCHKCNDDSLYYFIEDRLYMTRRKNQQKHDTKAIILCAGSGTRFGNDIPKGLIEFEGKSLIQRQVDQFKKAGISDITLITGYKSEMIKIDGVNYIHDYNHESHDILGSVMSAERLLCGNVIISYSDIVFSDNDLQNFLKNSFDFAIMVDADWKPKYTNRTEHYFEDADTVHLVNGRVIDFSKGGMVDTVEYVGVLKMSDDGCRYFKDVFYSNPYIHKKKLLDMFKLLVVDHGFSMHKMSEFWCEIDTQQDLELQNLSRVNEP